MEAMRESWTDDRLDDFRGEMSEFRRETKEEFRAVRQEMKGEFAAVRKEMKDQSDAFRGDIKALQQEMNLRFDSLHRLMIQFGGLVIAALIGLIATQA
jgi:hypothetical protein